MSTVVVCAVVLIQTLSCSYVVVGAVVVGSSWYLTRLARGPHGKQHYALILRILNSCHCVVIWTKSNPTPWNDVKQDENVKMMAVSQKFEKRYIHSSSSLA